MSWSKKCGRCLRLSLLSARANATESSNTTLPIVLRTCVASFLMMFSWPSSRWTTKSDLLGALAWPMTSDSQTLAVSALETRRIIITGTQLVPRSARRQSNFFWRMRKKFPRRHNKNDTMASRSSTHRRSFDDLSNNYQSAHTQSHHEADYDLDNDSTRTEDLIIELRGSVSSRQI